MTEAEKAKETKKEVSKGLGIAAMVVGIVATVFCWVPIFGLICGIAALIMSIIYLKKKPASKAFPIVGIIAGAVGIVVSSVVTVLLFTAVASVRSSYSYDLDEYFDDPVGFCEENPLHSYCN